MPAMLKSPSSGLRRAARLALCLACAGAAAEGWAADSPQPPAKAPAATSGKAHAHPSHYAPDRFAGRAGLYYKLQWGIDSISVKLVESGELVRFSYRVLDPAKAGVLNDKQTAATLNDPQAGVSLAIPTMEKIGQLRQGAPPEAGRSYWMTFSNKGRRVARGHRVDVVIGPFKASNLVVD
jgi:hypothetical protein